jgi:hypothetical protein
LAELPLWRICHSTVVGSSHLRSETVCQDFSGYKELDDCEDPAILLFVADGAGTATKSDKGAEAVCVSFANYFETRLSAGASISDFQDSECRTWLAIARERLRDLASEQGCPQKEFSCTFLGAILGASSSVFMQIGDGAIVVSCPEEPDEYDWVMWPEESEFANMTYFVTGDDAEDHLQTAFVAGRVDEVALFTDGLQRLALHMATKSAHSPFFRHFFAALRSQPPGYSSELSEGLCAFLGSKQVLERTDDDKSLLLATRIHPLRASD